MHRKRGKNKENLSFSKRIALNKKKKRYFFVIVQASNIRVETNVNLFYVFYSI